MKRLTKIIITLVTTLVLLGIFYFLFPHVWGDLIYPLDYQGSIKKYALERNLDPNLICAYIYVESRFNPGSVSGAGAMGLMQLMPGTAATVAEELSLSNFSSKDLLDPDTNINLGTKHLQDLTEEYSNNQSMIAAAYNGGGGLADRLGSSASSFPYAVKIKSVKESYDRVYGAWWAEPEVKKPNPFYQDIGNIRDFVKGLILGK